MLVAIIEDDSGYRDVLRDCLEGTDWDVIYFSNSFEFEEANWHKYDAIICDYYIPMISGVELLGKVWEKGHRPEMALMSGYLETIKDIYKPYINQIIDKAEPRDIRRWLDYIRLKKEVTEKIDKEITQLTRISHEKKSSKDVN